MTQDSEEWTGWFDHDGTCCPCVGSYVQAEMDKPFVGGGNMREGKVVGGPCWVWAFGKIVTRRENGVTFVIGRVIRYRIRKPRALRDLITLVETLPAPQRHTQEADG